MIHIRDIFISICESARFTENFFRFAFLFLFREKKILRFLFQGAPARFLRPTDDDILAVRQISPALQPGPAAEGEQAGKFREYF